MTAIYPKKDMTLKQKFKCGRRYFKEVRNSLVGTGWKKKDVWIFKEHEGWYFTAYVIGGFDGCRDEDFPFTIHSEFSVKPMAVDLINWDIEGLSGNKSKPLSFRSNAAFKVAPLTLDKRKFEGRFEDPVTSGQALIELLADQEKVVTAMLSKNSFDKLILESEQASDRQVLLWTTLIAAGRCEEALALIEECYLIPMPDEPSRQKRALEIVDRYRRYVETVP